MGKASSRNGQAHRHLTPHETVIRALSDRLVDAQKPIRILDAVKWDDRIERAFFARDGKELPPVTGDYYASRPLPFDPMQKDREFAEIEQDIHRLLGRNDPPGRIMLRMCREYRDVVRMLLSRGTGEFTRIASRLYGSAAEPSPDGEARLFERCRCLVGEVAAEPAANDEPESRVSAAEAVAILAQRLAEYFSDDAAFRVRISDGIVADAAAGSDYIKLRGDATFTGRDLHVLEVHEGWVHLGTTINGQHQPVCTFLSKGPPSSTITQEGLAVLAEMLTGVAHPARIRRLLHRIEGIALAEQGADFCEVYQSFLDLGYLPRDSYQQTMRVFRGSLPAGCGPFTKDICYGKGLLQLVRFIAGKEQHGTANPLQVLFCGKTTLADLSALAHLVKEGLVDGPRHVPPPFRIDQNSGQRTGSVMAQMIGWLPSPLTDEVTTAVPPVSDRSPTGGSSRSPVPSGPRRAASADG